MASFANDPDVIAAQERINAAKAALIAADAAANAAPEDGDLKKAAKAAKKAVVNAEKEFNELPVVAQAALDKEEATLAVAVAALAASPDDSTLKKDVKKQTKIVAKATKCLKLALKKNKGNAWDSETKSAQSIARKAAKAAKAAEKAAKAAAKAKEGPWINPTPKGQKKDTSGEMPTEYLPERVEAAWGEWWEAQGVFSPSAEEALKKDPDERFTIVIPPPNVTGSLHIGHALTIAIEDAVVRWHRMNGKSVLWLPGTDHAGIATQTQVEKLLMKETGQTKHDIGREALLKKIWEWKEKKGGRITKQIRELGASVDWKREVFTMDESLSVAVTEAFVRMYEKGLIYRQKRLVNWCSKLNTAISDIEVDHEDLKGRTLRKKVVGHNADHEYEFGVIISFAYKVEGMDEEVVVATTRLETMLGDTAVAVHPEDPRYKHLHGKRLVHPFRSDDHPHKTIPLVLDDILVDMAFGTGAVKITPAHDPNDYECGRRHELEQINILDDSGAINVNGGDEFAGVMRFDAREQILKKLDAMGLYRGTENNPMQIPICSRSGDIVEPRLKPQWFVNTTSMAARALKSVENGELKIIPAEHKAKWDWWLGNIRHWCISRQLWWGHRIPAFLVKIKDQPLPDSSDPENWVVARTEEEALKKAVDLKGVSAENIILEQDPDVLDTWFSSGLFPFSTMGWPNEESPDLKAFFPGSLLETGHDILFFWVARMVMMSQTLTDKLPFKEVYLHAMVRDKYGKKMSKSKGNVVDPLDVINGSTLQNLIDTLNKSLLPEKEIIHASAAKKKEFPKGIPRCGADALRFGLLAYTSQGRDVNLDINRVIGYRKFCNKIWNLHKLGLFFGLQDISPPSSINDLLTNYKLSEHDRWILSRLHGVMVAVDKAFVTYNMADACTACYDFLLKEFAATYAEISKPAFRGDAEEPKKAALATFYTILEISYRLLHPMMPFVTEELWQRLPRASSSDESTGETKGNEASTKSSIHSIALATFPNPAKDSDLALLQNIEAESRMNTVIATADAIRRLQGKFLTGKASSAKPAVLLVCSDEESMTLLASHTGDIGSMCRLDNIKCVASGTTIAEGMAVSLVNSNISVYVMLKGHVDFAAQLPELRKKLKKQVGGKKSLEDKRTPEYLAKANDEIQYREKEILSEYSLKIELLEEQISMFEKLA